jgi:type I restriction enzyme R subunit
MTVDPPTSDSKTTSQLIDEIWQNQERDYNIRRLVKRLRRIDKQMSGDARDLFARFVPDGDVGRFSEELPAQLRESFSETMKLLRDIDFQKLLVDYPRPSRTFLVAPGAIDTVESEWLIKGATGHEYKPEDYLQLFTQFVQDNASQIEALSILLSHPDRWNGEAIRQLREALLQAPEHFTEQNLQRAFKIAHHKALTDIISMVKRAALDTSPLLDAEERVARAVGLVVGDRTLSPEQSKWMILIRRHLVENLSIDREDFELVPVLSDRGGWRPANKAFEGELEDLLISLNRELAAA